MTPDQMSKLPPELQRAAENEKPSKRLTCPSCERIGFDRKNLRAEQNLNVKCYTCGAWSAVEDWLKRSESPLNAALTYCLQMQEERDRLKQEAADDAFHNEFRDEVFDKQEATITDLREERDGVYSDYQDAVKRLNTAEATIATLTRERDEAQEQRDLFLRDGSRPLDVLAREIVQTLRPTDAPGSSEYNVVWVGSKLKSIVAALSHTPEGKI